MTEEKVPAEEVRKFEWVPPRDGHAIPEIYTNYLIASWTMYDVRARIGQLVPSGPGPRDFVVEERAALTMSWAHAKSVATLLARMVAEYEKANGQIPVLKLPLEATNP